ncbi:MAG TPA: polyprenyl synthetase family protein [Bacillota bacterium]|nr:polyprenyl synthetase family protein [Bacillota bacterium]
MSDVSAAEEHFAARLGAYKRAIDDDIASYALHIRDVTRGQYGSKVADIDADVFLDILTRGGKRIRGALVMAGYEMCGGTNQEMIVQVARAIEMLHAYILIIDDIQDRSSLRRGKPTAHKMLTAYHRKHRLQGDEAHAGISLALDAALAGAHAAEMILANVNADAELRLKVLSIVNRTMAITAHGQTLDIMNELVKTPEAADIERVLEWKTALYTIINPLHVGMVLAGADCRATDAITPYGQHVGKAFQITDDILGIYGNEQSLGKTPGDDIREGKGTVLTMYALRHASQPDAAFLRSCLGKQDLTHAEFTKCRAIIETSGALAHAKKMALDHARAALTTLDEATGLWSEDGTVFLRSLVAALQGRAA